MTWLFKLWCCNHLPWHRPALTSFWVSQRAEVSMCSCGREWVTNHELGASLPWDEETRAFYRRLGSIR